MTDILTRLQNYVGQAFPELEAPRVGALTSLNSGWESDVYSFELESGPAAARTCQSRILRIYPAGDAQEKARAEYRTLTLLARMGYPVPRPDWLETDPGVLSHPFIIMEKIDGDLLWPLLFHGPAEQQPALLTLFCGLLLRLHRLDWQPYVPDEAAKLGDAYQYARGMIEQARWLINTFDLPNAQLLVNWLEERLPGVPCANPGVVHWDFHPNNILIRPDHSAVVIDWTGAAISDPRFDLAWTLLLVECYEGEEWRARVLAEYERLRGSPLEGMDFFDAFACGRRLLSVAVSMTAGAGALGMRPGAEKMMAAQAEPLRRVAARLLRVTGLTMVDVDQLMAG